jgi:hypothetical protein
MMRSMRQELAMTSARKQTVLDAIVGLAEEIGRLSPDCARQAMQIVDLVRGLEAEPDLATVQDALDAEVGETGFSDVTSQRAATAIVRAVNDPDPT